MRKLIIVASFLLSSAAIADPVPPMPPKAPSFVPLNEAQMTTFLNALSEISMPQRAYQQVIGVYRQIEQEAQRGRSAENK